MTYSPIFAEEADSLPANLDFPKGEFLRFDQDDIIEM